MCGGRRGGVSRQWRPPVALIGDIPGYADRLSARVFRGLTSIAIEPRGSRKEQDSSNSENTRGEHQDTPTMKLPTTPPIYLDYHATTPVDPRVAAVILHAMTTAFGNANSTEHIYGEVAAALIGDARRAVAALVNRCGLFVGYPNALARTARHG